MATSLASSTHSIQLQGGLPHGLGLLTTVASLPPKYRSRYLNLKAKYEIPLDLSVKPPTPEPQIVEDEPVEVPMPLAFQEISSESTTIPIPESSSLPTDAVTVKKRKLSIEKIDNDNDDNDNNDDNDDDDDDVDVGKEPASKIVIIETTSSSTSTVTAISATSAISGTSGCSSVVEINTPSKPIVATESPPRTSKASTNSGKPSRNKATRKLKFDEETSSPVSGTIIRPLEDITDGTQQYSNGDIDPKYNIVEITEETKAELAAIKNVIGDYVCRLCRIKFDDAFGLARHRCACIVLLEYRCPECGKQFNCPANLASHRRWHKPKQKEKENGKIKDGPSNGNGNGNGNSNGNGNVNGGKKENRNTMNQINEMAFDCGECGKKFKRAAYLRKHQLMHAKKEQNAEKAEKEDKEPLPELEPQPVTTITGSFKTTRYAVSTSTSTSTSSTTSSTHEDEGVYMVVDTSGRDRGRGSGSRDPEPDYLSDCSSSTSSSASAGYGRLQIVEHVGLTEEESIAAAALTNLRNCASVIQHTTMAH